MAREIVKNLKFKKYNGKFDPMEFGKLLDEAYLATKRPDGEMTKKSFSPSSFGYGQGNCPRYWYMAFSGAYFIDNNDAQAVANMKYGTEAHERLQSLIKSKSSDLFQNTKILSVETEVEIKNEYPPIRGFIDLVMDWDGTKVIGEIKTAKQEVWDTRQSEMSPTSNHILQLLTYMKLKGTDEGFFVYENKNTQEILVIPVQMNERNSKIINELFEWLKGVWDNYNGGDLPVRPEGYTKSKAPCLYCPIKKECWSKTAEVGTVEIAPYEVNKG